MLLLFCSNGEVARDHGAKFRQGSVIKDLYNTASLRSLW